MASHQEQTALLAEDPEAGIAIEPEAKTLTFAPSKAGGGASKRSATTAKRSTKSRTKSGKRKPSSSKRSKPRSQERQRTAIKYGSLLLLVAQMVGLVLLMRYSRTKGASHTADGGEELYISSTAVFLMEAAKLMICIVVVFLQSGSTVSGLSSALHAHVWMAPYEVAKLCIPSLLYTIQNNLLYFALSNLDAATYQVCYQLKILTTALFSVALLKRQFSATKWFSLFLLTAGVAVVQTLGSAEGSSGTSDKVEEGERPQNRFLGLVAVLFAACTSGFSGVYFEMILKGSQTSLWLRNIQMGLPSVLIAYTTVYLKDGGEVSSRGFFVGYNNLVWAVVMVQAAGGLIVAVVVKYADNVLKVFATSFSIIMSCFVSAFLFDFRPNLSFCIGTVFVMMSTVLYARPEPRRKTKTVLPMTKAGGRKSNLTL